MSNQTPPRPPVLAVISYLVKAVSASQEWLGPVWLLLGPIHTFVWLTFFGTLSHKLISLNIAAVQKASPDLLPFTAWLSRVPCLRRRRQNLVSGTRTTSSSSREITRGNSSGDPSTRSEITEKTVNNPQVSQGPVQRPVDQSWLTCTLRCAAAVFGSNCNHGPISLQLSVAW